MNKELFSKLYEACNQIIEKDCFIKIPMSYDYGELYVDIEDFSHDCFSFDLVGFKPRSVIAEFLEVIGKDDDSVIDTYHPEIYEHIHDDVLTVTDDILREELRKKRIDISEINSNVLLDICAYVASGYDPNDAWEEYCDHANDDLEEETEDQYITVNGVRYKKVEE